MKPWKKLAKPSKNCSCFWDLRTGELRLWWGPSAFSPVRSCFPKRKPTMSGTQNFSVLTNRDCSRSRRRTTCMCCTYSSTNFEEIKMSSIQTNTKWFSIYCNTSLLRSWTALPGTHSVLLGYWTSSSICPPPGCRPDGRCYTGPACWTPLLAWATRTQTESVGQSSLWCHSSYDSSFQVVAGEEYVHWSGLVWDSAKEGRQEVPFCAAVHAQVQHLCSSEVRGKVLSCIGLGPDSGVAVCSKGNVGVGGGWVGGSMNTWLPATRNGGLSCCRDGESVVAGQWLIIP